MTDTEQKYQVLMARQDAAAKAERERRIATIATEMAKVVKVRRAA
jgi:hypothetical protein